MSTHNLPSSFGTHQLDLENKLIIQIWKNEDEKMTDENFKEVMLEYKSLVEQYRINKVIVDTQYLNFILVPKLQDWVNEEVSVVTIPLTQKIAFVIPPSLFEQVAIEQTMVDAEHKGRYQTKYFENIEEARTWIFS